MTNEEKDSWQKIKAHFETLPEHKRDNMFYKRAVAICGGEKDPLDIPSFEPTPELKNDE